MTTFLNKRAIQKRMQCKARTAARIDNQFVTVEQLVTAIESDKPLVELDGIGPTTADAIMSWWDVRFEREEQMQSAEFVKTGAQTASVYNLGDWSAAIGLEEDDG